MKRNFGVLAFLTILSSALVSAGPVQGVQQLTQGLREMIVIVIQFVGNTVFDINSFGEFLFAKILLFTLILIITYSVIKKNTLFGGRKNRPVQWIVASAVSILAIKYLPDNFIQAILLQYGAFAVAVTVFLPLIIYFFFIHQSEIGHLGRQVGWIVFASAFFALWSFRYEDLGSANIIYWIAIGFFIIVFLFDRKIHEYFGLSSYRKAKEGIRNERRVEALRKLEELEKDKAKGFYEGRERAYERLKEHLKTIIRDNL